MAKQTYMSRVKAYRKLHPRCTQQEAMKKLAGKKVTGTKVSGARAKTKTPQKKSITKTEKVTVIGAVKKRSPGISGAYHTGMKIIAKIDKMEAKLKTIKGREAKDLLKRLINAEHDKLDALKKSIKKSA